MPFVRTCRIKPRFSFGLSKAELNVFGKPGKLHAKALNPIFGHPSSVNAGNPVLGNRPARSKGSFYDTGMVSRKNASAVTYINPMPLAHFELKTGLAIGGYQPADMNLRMSSQLGRISY